MPNPTPHTRTLLLQPWQAQAARAGLLSQVRVPLKPQPPLHWSIPPARLVDGYLNRWGCTRGDDSIRCPWDVGDVLLGKETWQVLCGLDGIKTAELPDDARKWINYPANGNKWYSRVRPAAQMPPWAVRFAWKVTAVRVERCRAVTEADAAACGIRQDKLGYWWPYPTYEARSPSEAMGKLWDDRYGRGSFDRDDYVAVGTLERCEVRP